MLSPFILVYLSPKKKKILFFILDDPNKVHIEELKNDNTFEIDEISTCPASLVKVYKDGTVRTVRLKRMAEAETCKFLSIAFHL